jgi:peptide/nickel transport system substrate-binding protein
MIRTSTRRWVAAAAALGLGASLAVATTTSATAATAKVLNIGSSFNPGANGYNPHKTNGQPFFWETMYDGLFVTGASGAVKPSLVTTFSYSADNTKLTLNLRKGVKFTDGSVLTAALVKANLDLRSDSTLVAYGNLRAKGTYEVSSVDVVGDAVVITFAKAQPNGINAFVDEAGIVVGATAVLNAKALAAAPNGCGPYTLSKAGTIKNNRYTLVKNPKYWNAKAYSFSQIVYRIFASNQAQANAYVSGQIAYGILDNNSTLSFLQSRKATLASMGGKISMLLFWDKLGKNVPAFKDVRVRQAIGLAIDRKSYVSALHKGDAPTVNAVAKGFPGYVASLDTTWGYNPTKAKQLLADAGYANGFTMTVTIGADVASEYGFIAKQLAAVGITMNTKIAATTEESFGAVVTEGFGLLPGVGMTDPFGFMVGVVVNGFANLQHAEDPAIGAGIGQYIGAGDDKAKQKAALEALNTALVTQAWVTPLLETKIYVEYNPKVLKKVTFEQGVNQPHLWTLKAK